MNRIRRQRDIKTTKAKCHSKPQKPAAPTTEAQREIWLSGEIPGWAQETDRLDEQEIVKGWKLAVETNLPLLTEERKWNPGVLGQATALRTPSCTGTSGLDGETYAAKREFLIDRTENGTRTAHRALLPRALELAEKKQKNTSDSHHRWIKDWNTDQKAWRKTELHWQPWRRPRAAAEPWGKYPSPKIPSNGEMKASKKSEDQKDNGETQLDGKSNH
jgi:hypothetical protein